MAKLELDVTTYWGDERHPLGHGSVPLGVVRRVLLDVEVFGEARDGAIDVRIGGRQLRLDVGAVGEVRLDAFVIRVRAAPRERLPRGHFEVGDLAPAVAFACILHAAFFATDHGIAADGGGPDFEAMRSYLARTETQPVAASPAAHHAEDDSFAAPAPANAVAPRPSPRPLPPFDVPTALLEGATRRSLLDDATSFGIDGLLPTADPSSSIRWDAADVKVGSLWGGDLAVAPHDANLDRWFVPPPPPALRPGDGCWDFSARIQYGAVVAHASAPTAAAAPARTTTTAMTTPLHPVEIGERILHQSSGNFASCFQTAAKHDPALTGRWTVEFVVGRDGTVTWVSVTGDHDVPALDACIIGAVRSLSFPESDRATTYQRTMRLDDEPKSARGTGGGVYAGGCH